jgi:deazaflavin-dependent oxidoreductase (nitroreductase family)
MLPSDDARALARDHSIYLTTIGRRTGLPRTVELWFAYSEGYVLLMSHERTNWYRNLQAQPATRFRVGQREFRGHAEMIADQAGALQRIKDLFRSKYGDAVVREWYEGTERVAIQIRVEGRLQKEHDSAQSQIENC